MLHADFLRKLPMLRSAIVAIACLAVAGCPPVGPPPAASVLAGLWLITPADPGDTEFDVITATFDGNGNVVELKGTTAEGGSVTRTVSGATTELNGNSVTISVPKLIEGTAVFEGTLSQDQNTMSGSITDVIQTEELQIIVPGGELTLERIITDPCDAVTCESGETCVDGECVTSDPCDGVTCADGETCVDGECVADDPCDGVTCEDGEHCADGECVSDGDGGNAPTLVGLDPDKAIVLPFTVQVAYNDDTAFFHMSWEGDKGDTHDYFRYTNGAWQREGGVRRDAQSTIDNDPVRGPTNVNSTIYESRVTFMLDDPTGPNAVEGFLAYGCTLTCHDNSRAMPTWRNEDGEVHKYLPDDISGRLDLWHHRLGRANPMALSDDQWVGQRTGDEGDDGGGSRHGDAGTGPYATGSFDDDGNPPWAFDPDTAGGLFAFGFEDLFTSPLRSIFDETAENLGPNAPNPVAIDYADAVAMGYEPSEGDTIPRRRLRQTEGSRGDITAAGTTFTPSAGDPLFGRWDSNIQRVLDTGNDDDTALADGNVYNIAFAVHTGMVTVRDHYVSFAYTLSLGGGDADIQAVQIAGSGRDALPDFSDTTMFPVTNLNTFLPGIASYEFVNGDNVGLEYIDPATGTAVDQNHAGAAGLTTQGLSCRACHTAADGETFAPPQEGGFPAGAMETLTPQRGGVNTPTPIPPG